MICAACRNRQHHQCAVGCCCQHRGTGLPWADAAARHTLAVGPPPARIIHIGPNGVRP